MSGQQFMNMFAENWQKTPARGGMTRLMSAIGGPQWQTQAPPQPQQQSPFMGALSGRLMSQAPRMGQGGFNMFRPPPRPNTASPWASAFQSQIPMMRGSRFPMGFG